MAESTSGSTTASSTCAEKASPSELAALREEIAELRIWTQKELERERYERQKEAKYTQNAVNILAQRSDAEIKARFKLAEHVQELVGEAKRNVEAVCAECAKQQDSIKDLWGCLNTVSVMLRGDQHPLVRVQEWIMEAKRHTEKVRAECQKHENVTDGLCNTLRSVAHEFNLDTPPEDAHSKNDSAEWMKWLSTSAKPKLEGVLTQYEAQLHATHGLLDSITSLRTSFEKEPPEKVIKSQNMDEAFLNFMAVVVERDAGDGKGLVKVMSTLSEAIKFDSVQSGEQAEEWLGGVRKSLTEACRECELQKQATSDLFEAIVKSKQKLNEQLQERIRLHDSGRPKWSAPAPQESQAKKEPVNWQLAIEDMMKRGETTPSTQNTGDEVYQADNSILKASTPGLGFRNTPDLADMDKDKVLVPWGSLVCGVSHDDDWLKVGDRYLPKYLKKVAVLRPWQEPPKNSVGTVPSDGASSPRSRASSVPVLEPIPESPTREDRAIAMDTREDRPCVDCSPPRTFSADSMGTDSSDVQTQPESPSKDQSIDEEPKTVSQAELREFVTSTINSAFQNLQDELRHEAARALDNLQKGSSLTSLSLESNLKGEIERLREQIPLEISQCFAKNKPAMVEQAAELKKSTPLLLDEKLCSEIEAVARKVYSERTALEKLRPDRSPSPYISGSRPAGPRISGPRAEQAQQGQLWGSVTQLKVSGADEPARDRRRSNPGFVSPAPAAAVLESTPSPRTVSDVDIQGSAKLVKQSRTEPALLGASLEFDDAASPAYSEPPGSHRPLPAFEMLPRSSTDSAITEAQQVFLSAKRAVSPSPIVDGVVSLNACPPSRSRMPLSSRNTFPSTSPAAVRASSQPDRGNHPQVQARPSSAVSPRGVSPIPPVSCEYQSSRIVVPLSNKSGASISGPAVAQPAHLSAVPTRRPSSLTLPVPRPGALPARVPESPRGTHRAVRSGAMSPSPVVTPRRENISPAATTRRLDGLSSSYKSIVSAVSTAMSSVHSDRSDGMSMKAVVSV